MQFKFIWAGCLGLSMLVGCADEPAPAPAPVAATPSALAAAGNLVAPRAEAREHVVRAPHGAERRDEYYWLRDDSRSDPQVLAYLEAENRYADARLQPLQALQQKLYAEISARVVEDASSEPYLHHGYWYWTRFRPGADYPQQLRRRDGEGAAEEVVLDEAAMAVGHVYYAIGDWEISPDGAWLLWSEDLTGRRQYQLRVKRLGDGEVAPDRVAGAAPDLLWAADGRSFYYIENDPVTLLGQRVKRHVMGRAQAEDELVYAESDPGYYMSLLRTRSERFVCVHLSSTLASEQRCLDQQSAQPQLQVLQPRERGIEYDADHLGDRWVIRSNWQAQNFRLLQARTDHIGRRERWRELLAHDPQVLLEDFLLFDGFVAVQEMADALPRLRILREGAPALTVDADEAAYTMSFGDNAEPGLGQLRYEYSSLATPPSVFDFDVASGERQLRRQDPLPPDYRSSDYVIERLAIPARDGASIPVSLIRHKDTAVDGTAALFQYAYGSYGSSTEPRFSPVWASLLDRGVVFAIAHVRGGSERGRDWYEQGRLLNKMNTFTDFIDVTDALVAKGYAAPGRVAAMGRSAGGLLMGAIAHLAPEKYRVIVTQVPFVDALTTMLDPSIPLTTNEYDEWGNPEQPEFYDYIARYSPYDNLRPRSYPAMYVSTGLWDSQVQYYEPAKYVARLRTVQQGSAPILFRTDMKAGHGGGSGRMQRYQDAAEYQSFVLDRLGLAE